jgi:uncharacterized protein YyaL (SSP411 family)
MDHKTFKDPNVIGTRNRDFIAIRVAEFVKALHAGEVF